MVNNMKASQHLLDLLVVWEGLELKPYKDVAGLLTIGIGHLLTEEEKKSGFVTIQGKKVPWHYGITKEQAFALKLQDMVRFENAVNKSVTVSLTQNQYEALVSFAYNVGVGAFESSTLLKKLNQGKYAEVPAELAKWVKAKGKTIQGLVNRRNNEIKLWEGKL